MIFIICISIIIVYIQALKVHDNDEVLYTDYNFHNNRYLLNLYNRIDVENITSPLATRTIFMNAAKIWNDDSYYTGLKKNANRIKHLVYLKNKYIVNYRHGLTAKVLVWEDGSSDPLVFPSSLNARSVFGAIYSFHG